MTSDEFKKLGYQLIDWIAEYRQKVADLPVQAQVKPGEIKSRFPQTPPTKGGTLSEVIEDLEKMVPGLTSWQSPHFYAWFPSNAPLHSVLADIVATGFGNTGITWQASPALSEVEEVMNDWLRQMFGLPNTFRGVIQDTASTATLVAMLSARERSTQHSQNHGGLQAEEKPLVCYVSDQAHSSVPKAVLLAGFGRDNLRLIETDQNFAMRMDRLEQAIQRDIAQGRKPCAVVAAIGTTGTTAIDPLEKIIELAGQYDLWVHVDAAMAGSAMILPECRWMWKGVEDSDSIAINPHKWLGVAFDCSLYFVRDPDHLVRVMSTNPSYLQGTASGEVVSYKDWGIPLGRRFRSLKILFALRAEGVEGLQHRLRRDLENAKWLEGQIRQTPYWKILAPVYLQTLCLRYEPPDMNAEEVSQHTKTWVDRINASGKAMLTPALLGKHWIARVSIGQEHTQREHVATLWQLMQKEANSR